MWCTSNGFGSLATVGGFKVGLVHARSCALNEAAAITELVVVEAVRTSDSGGQAMREPSDDMSGGGKNRDFGTWELGIRTRIPYYPKKHSTNRTRDKSSRRQFYEEGGGQRLVHTRLMSSSGVSGG